MVKTKKIKVKRIENEEIITAMTKTIITNTDDNTHIHNNNHNNTDENENKNW